MNELSLAAKAITVAALLTTASFGFAQSKEDLAKQSQNPIGNLISVPFENNTEFGVGPEDALVNVLNLKPVYPVDLGDWNLINRFILPIAYQEERFPDEGSEFGLGNFTYQAFLAPAQPDRVVWGAGAAVVAPTNTDDRFGGDKWSAGPAVVRLWSWPNPGPG